MKTIEKQRSSTDTIKSIVITLTVVCYVIFSIVKRWGNNDDLFWIPLVLTFANMAILLEIFFSKKASLLKNNIWLYAQLLLNIALALLICTFLYN